MKLSALLLVVGVGGLWGQSVALQPLAQQVRRLEDALAFLGQPLPEEARRGIAAGVAAEDEAAGVKQIEAALAPFVLARVEINAEARVKVERGAARAELVQGGTRAFLIQVVNLAHVTSPLVVTSPNAAPLMESYRRPASRERIGAAELRDRWAQFTFFRRAPLMERLSGLELEYVVLEVMSRDAGQRAGLLAFDVGQGTQDIGFRNDISILFEAAPARRIGLEIRDERGAATTASLTIRDGRGRLYPNPSKRLAPDFFFQPQVYRKDGETIELPHGEYTMVSTGGPEYVARTARFVVDGKGPRNLAVKLERWIDPARQYGWYSGDPHIHAAGCSHYQKPSEGVNPEDMIRQIAGEKLNLASVLTWGPGYYHQKKFFTGQDDRLSSDDQLMHYDLEVSGFPSSDSGHLALLGLKEQDYPGTAKLEDWPSWNVPILEWAKKQGAVTGYTHSGWGLQVMDGKIPSLAMPGFDGIGANEYIVDVTRPGTIDFIAGGDTPPVWELSIWYHTLNVGYRTKIAGETDFPCITDERVGLGRTYVKLDAPLTYRKWIDGLKEGRSYLSDGRMHLMDFAVGGKQGEVKAAKGEEVEVTVEAVGLLDRVPNRELQALSYDQHPGQQRVYWTIERARVGDTNEVPVELVRNGKVIATATIPADGKRHRVSFRVKVEGSAWLAARVMPAAHTNPVWVKVGEEEIAERESAEWCLRAVEQCWSQKARFIRPGEKAAARAAYDAAREAYRKKIEQARDRSRE
ncbi:MAG: CehA/McbA family metallohydrolase [Bryobacter sp.]|jgi:hypothetical protein|nr:CehA/McbA family metallohydrolase [Bryobacter sp. CoA8 C33]